MNIWAHSHLTRTNASTTTQNKLHLILLLDTLLISMMVRLKAHSPTGATGTVHRKSAPDSHSGKELVTASEDPLFVSGFVISLAKSSIFFQSPGRNPRKDCSQATGLAMTSLVPTKQTAKQTHSFFTRGEIELLLQLTYLRRQAYSGSLC